MNSIHPQRFAVLAFALAAATASAQTPNDDLPAGQAGPLAAAISSGDAAPLNHFSASFRAGFNFKPKFQGLGGFPEWIVRDPALPQDRTYADGYVRVDNHGDAHAPPPYDQATWFWAYADEATQTAPVPGSVLMHIDSSPQIGSTKGDDDMLPGFELVYNRELGKLGRARWGLEAAFGFMHFDYHDQNSYVAAVSRRTDQYDFPPLAGDPKSPGFPSDPYGGEGPGTFNGPGQLLGDAVVASGFVPNFGSVMVNGQHRFEGNIFSGRLGPYLEIPLTKRLAFSLSGGLSLVGVQSDFSYDESVSLPALGTEGHSAAGSHGDVLVGGYVSGSLSLALCRNASVFVGGQFQSVGTYTQPLNNIGTLTQVENSKSAKLDMNATYFFTAGLTISF